VKFADIITREVVDLEGALVIGRVHDAILDSSGRAILGFTLRGSPGRNDWLAWEQIVAIGDDAVTVESIRTLTEQPSGKGRLILGDDVVGGRVLSDQGLLLSTISEVDFDPKTGRIVTVGLADGHTIPSVDLLGSGSYATIVRHQPIATSP
jgi:uncharacterized protein YrrD